MLKGGMIGCGFFGQIQLEAWRRMDDAQIVAAADPDVERARQAATAAYRTAEEMLAREELDFVDVATRPESHLELVRLAVSCGIPVICQKPMAPTWAEALAIAEAADESGVPVMIHENWRWQPWFREVKRRICGGAIGAPVAYHFRVRRKDGVGPHPFPAQPYFVNMPRLLIYETLVHHIDTARYLFGDVAWVTAHTHRINPIIAGEDQAVLTLVHECELMGVVDGHRYTDPVPDGGVLGEAWFEGVEGALFVRGDGGLYVGGKCVWQNQVNSGYRGDSVRATQQHFIDCLRSGAPFESGAREYLNTVAVVEAAYQSAASRLSVHVARLSSSKCQGFA